MKFNINIPRKYFKTQDDFLSQVYKDNPIIAQKGISETVFKKQIDAYKIIRKTNVSGAIKAYSNTTTFTPYQERATQNIINVLKEHGKFKTLTTALRDTQGHFTKFDRSQLVWSKENGAYIYAQKFLIDLQNSPERVDVRTI